MTLRVIGAGIGRTGTLSLKQALERLLGEPCYHMEEVMTDPVVRIPLWRAAVRGELDDWEQIMGGYAAAVDWPAGSFYPELMAAYPDALVLLSTRADAEVWWRSANATIIATCVKLAAVAETEPDGVEGQFSAMISELMSARFVAEWTEHDAAVAAYDAHNARVRATVPAARLLEWQPGDGWGPLCKALDLPIPDEPFPHVNSTEEFLFEDPI